MRAKKIQSFFFFFGSVFAINGHVIVINIK